MFRPSTMVLFFIGLLIAFTSISQSSTSTYSNGIIPFSFNTYDAGCNGPMSPLVVNIPAGSTVTSIEISYDVIAGNGAWMSEQRTAVHCHETGGTEGAISGSGGNSGGTESYNRTGVGIANGFSASGVLTFEMRAWRTWGGTTCETSYQNVVNNTWSIKVNYMIAGPIVSPGGVPNAEVWFDASNGAVGSPVTQWNNLGVNSNIPSLTSPSGGTITNSDLKANYNSVITTTGGYSGTFHAEVSNRNQLIAGNQVTMYVAYLGNNAPDLTFEFHGSVQTSASSNGANQWLTWGFRHGGMGVLYSNGTGFAYNTPSIAGISHNSAFAGLNGTANSVVVIR